MTTFHTIAGLPRSGSTLLCNLLSQRSDTYVSSTSALPLVLGTVSEVMTNSPEVTSDLVNVAGAESRTTDVLRGVVDAWYKDLDVDVIVDKSRGWAQYSVMLNKISPSSMMILTVRDPREVFASVERQHRASGEYGPYESVYDKASNMLSPEGLIGSTIAWCEDVVRRRMPNVLFVSYDTLCTSPVSVMSRIDESLGLDPWEYDFENVENQSTDLDALYRFKFPHDGSGKVSHRPSGWSDVIDDELASLIAGRWPYFMQAFGFVR